MLGGDDDDDEKQAYYSSLSFFKSTPVYSQLGSAFF
jgi:hypothetical protein